MSETPVPDVGESQSPAERVPPWLAPLLEAVLADLQHPNSIDLRVGWTGADEGTGTLWMQEIASAPEVTGLSISRDDDAHLTVMLAEQLQEQFFPETVGAWGQARPACPGHSHPAEPTLDHAVACWACPTTGNVLGRIGQGPR